jgi:nicotinamide-nucleotide amidase
MKDLINEVHNLLLASKYKISFAESCTGGLVQKLITDNSGSSSYFEGGLVVYSNRLKNELLGVANDLLEKHGAVSSQCALAMVEGLYRLTQADICVSVTGIAGPNGGSKDKPVGSVYFAFRFNKQSQSYFELFPGDRESVRNQSANFVLEKIKDYLTRGCNESISIR